MKKIFLIIIFSVTIVHLGSAQLKSEVSECFELTSIVFRLAGAPEYVNNQLQHYTPDIDSYFATYINHPLIPFLQKMRKEYVISYNSVVFAAGCITIKDNQVIAKPELDVSKIHELDGRWRKENFETFVTLLNDFYRQTNFPVFYLQHRDIYKVAIEKMDELLKNIKVEWFENMFGEELGEVTIIVSLCNGTSNYAIPIVEQEIKKAIVIGCSNDDRNGLPQFTSSKLTVIIHELLHHYTNNRIIAYWSEIERAAQKIYNYIYEDMAKNAYGDSETTMIEWFTNLCMILYFRDNPNKQILCEHSIGRLQHRGFIWIDRSFQFMEHFYENRTTFSTIDDYMPQLVEFIKFTAANFDQVIQEHENRFPYVVDVFPAPGSVLPPAINTIEIRFSQRMYGPSGLDIIEDENILVVPVSEKPFWKDEYTFIIPFDPNQLEDGKIYGLSLMRAPFQNRKMFSIKEEYIHF